MLFLKSDFNPPLISKKNLMNMMLDKCKKSRQIK